jgi:hypothetical protein
MSIKRGASIIYEGQNGPVAASALPNLGIPGSSEQELTWVTGTETYFPFHWLLPRGTLRNVW